MRRVLITGGTGYIGSHTAVEVAAANFEPVLVDNLANSSLEVIEGLTELLGFRPRFHLIDLCDIHAVTQLAEQEPCVDSIIHFAAFKAVAESVNEPLKYYSNNLSSLMNVLEVFKNRRINFVFSSSCTVYGEPDTVPVTEQTPQKIAKSPYGRTKQISEEILQQVATSSKSLRVISLRYFNPVGAHKSALIGELPIGVPQNLVPFITQTAIGKRDILTVHGSDYNTNDGTNVRDFVHVVDLARAHVHALNKMFSNETGPNFDVYNLGTGIGRSVLEVIDAFEHATGIKLNYKYGPRRAGDVEQIWADVAKASSELDWQAGLTLREMVLSAWKWEKYLSNKSTKF